MTAFSTHLIDGIPLIAIVFGLVSFIKSLGVRGRLLTVISLMLGLLLGVATRLTLALPDDAASWFSTIIFGLALGLTASGFYDFVNERFPKAG